tara:strand:+ start:1352 stop:1567 length:216 start_codon:yes stop_codon:yes gene_type:complete
MEEWQWMIFQQSLEDELAMERSVRSIYNTKDLEEIQGLCAALVRQNWHQRKLLCQAVTRISEMDAQLACLE